MAKSKLIKVRLGFFFCFLGHSADLLTPPYQCFMLVFLHGDFLTKVFHVWFLKTVKDSRTLNALRIFFLSSHGGNWTPGLLTQPMRPKTMSSTFTAWRSFVTLSTTVTLWGKCFYLFKDEVVCSFTSKLNLLFSSRTVLKLGKWPVTQILKSPVFIVRHVQVHMMANVNYANPHKL